MPIKHADFIIKGMFRDLSEHAFNPEFAYENQNLRITAEPNSSSNHTGDMYALTNEKGNKYVPIWGLDSTGHNRMNGDKQIFNATGDMWGVPVGQALLNDKWVVFMIDRDKDIFIDGVEKEIEDFPIEETHINNLKVDSNDRIYKLWFNNDKMYGTLLYEGHLNLSTNFPLETLPYYENEQIQKVYWTDGLNQPRYINIEASDEERDKWTDTSFDFVSTIELLNNKVTITEYETGGVFPAGVVQWYFTYAKQFGPESNIFTQTGLYELKYPDRGAAPDEFTTQSFKIKLEGLDYEHFDSINIYSVIRTSLNGVPNCKLVANLKLTGSTIEYVDTNLTGEAIDPTSLFYKGGEPITAYTFEQKENTLFLGNYQLQRNYIPKEARNSLRNFAFTGSPEMTDISGRYLKSNKGNGFKFTNGIDTLNIDIDDFFPSTSTPVKTNTIKDKFVVSSLQDELTNSEDITYFKDKNYYRVGIQFQHYTGRWSEVVWLGDYKCTDKYSEIPNSSIDYSLYTIVLGYLKLTTAVKTVLQNLISLGYRMVRPVIVYPNISEKKVLGQGILCNTLRSSIDPYTVYPDYFFRSLPHLNSNLEDAAAYTYSQEAVFQQGVMPPFESYGEIWHSKVGEWEGIPNIYNNNCINDLSEVHFIEDGSICDLYTPDIEFDDSLKVYGFNNITLNKVSELLLSSNFTSVEIQTTTIPKASIGVYEWDNNTQFNAFFGKWGTSTIYYAWNTSTGSPNGFGENDNDDKGYDDVTSSNRYTIKSFYPQKMLFKQNNVNWNHHYVGGYVWNDYLRNTAVRQDETLGMEIPTKEGVWMAHSYNYIYPVFIWQPSGSICYDKDSDASSVLKSNKTLNYFKSASVNNNFNDSIRCKGYVLSDFDTKKLFYKNNTAVLYKNHVDTSLVHGDEYYAYVEPLWTGAANFDKARVFAGYNKSTEVFGASMVFNNGVNYIIRNKGANDKIKSIYRWTFDGAGHRNGLYKWTWSTDDGDSSESDGVDTFPWLKGSVKIYKDDKPWYCNNFVTQVKYKTTPHLTTILSDYAWSTSSISTSNDAPDVYLGHGVFSNTDNTNNTFPIVEIVQDVELSTIFGGYSDAIIQRNNFLPCGDTIPICHYEYNQETEKMELVPNTDIEIVWDKGDIHRQHYECLKTYPYTLEDENSVTEILDFEVETYWNMHGRYDSWKGNPQLSTMPSNWNLMNSVYNQQDNFMTYHGLDLSKFSINNFPNSFTWTLTKSAGDEIDKWTQITLANTLDVDMNRGSITKIIGLQDNLLCFQPKGISQILYNEREQISTASGVPIEIGNSGKVNGTRYLSVLAGCNNKWSMCKSEKGLYWVDDVNKQIMNFTTQVTNLSDTLGFHSWINDMASLNIWNPLGFNNFVSYFDPYNEDVVFYYKTNALSFSEQLNCFDTFLPYRFVPYYMAFHNSAFTLSDRDSDGKNTYKVWEHFKGDYNYFYVLDECVYDGVNLACKGKYDNLGNPTDFGYEPYWTTLLVNPDMPYDKVFNNLDTRTDMWAKDINGNYSQLLEETFSHIEVWNEFQWNKSYLVRQLDLPKIHYPAQHSILKKKFRVWYVNIPRDIKQDNPRARYYNRDRFRNTWTYIKLSKELVNNDSLIDYPYISDNKHVIHHVGVSYFV